MSRQGLRNPAVGSLLLNNAQKLCHCTVVVTPLPKPAVQLRQPAQFETELRPANGGDMSLPNGLSPYLAIALK